MKLKEVKQKYLKVGDIAHQWFPSTPSYEILSVTKDSLWDCIVKFFKKK